MLLNNIFQAKFIERQNRFVGKWILNNQKILFHIGDTGRLAELLFPWNKILIQKMPSDGRKYPFRLIATKGLQNKFILLNSLLHSALIREYLQKQNISYQPEVIINNSKLDFLIANKIFVEVKWCSLIKKINNEFVWMFPDAPTKRWQKHLQELINLLQQWKECQIRFLLTNNVDKFCPNVHTDPEFSKLFYQFLQQGWKVNFLYARLEFKNNQVNISLHPQKVEILKKAY